MIMVGETGGGEERAHPSRYSVRKTHNRKGTNPQVQVVDLQECWRSGWLQGCHRCAFRNGNGVGNRRGTRLVSTYDGKLGRRKKIVSPKKKTTNTKNNTLDDGRMW